MMARNLMFLAVKSGLWDSLKHHINPLASCLLSDPAH